MKKLLFAICALAITAQSFASHLMGGQITAQNIGGTTYVITLTVYRDTIGIPMSPQQTLNYFDATLIHDQKRAFLPSLIIRQNVQNQLHRWLSPSHRVSSDIRK